MNSRQIAYFVAVAETGSFTRAAARLGATRPMVSGAIRRLERETGAVLFERSPRTVTLAPAGQTFLPFARRVLAAVDDARAAVIDDGAEPRGDVRFGTLPTPLGVDVIAFTAEFVRSHPRVAPKLVTVRSPDELVDDVHHGALDIAVTATLTPASPPPGVEFDLLHSEPFHLLVAPAHPLARRATVDPAELAGERFVSFATGSSQRAGMDGVFAALGVPLNVAFECDGPSLLRFVATEGVCCIGLPTPTAMFEPSIVAIPFACEAPRSAVVIARPEARRMSPAVRTFAAALLALFR